MDLKNLFHFLNQSGMISPVRRHHPIGPATTAPTFEGTSEKAAVVDCYRDFRVSSH